MKTCKLCGFEGEESGFHRRVCMKCHNAARRKYYADHRQEELAKKRKYYIENKSTVLERDLRYREKNREKIIVRARKYYHDNAEMIIEKQRQYKQMYPDRVREWQKRTDQKRQLLPEFLEKKKEYTRKYSQEHREIRNIRHKEWIKKHPEVRTATYNRRRTRLAGNGGSFSPREWLELCEKYDNKCLGCGEIKKLTADHIIPVALGGTSNIDNIQPLCKSCNTRKHIKIIDYRKKNENAETNIP